jgi:hypothetical protein
MPFYGIVDNTNPVGQVPISQNNGQFREAADAATALADFVASFATPKNPADYLAFDTGWVSPQMPSMGKRWGYDFGTSALVEIDSNAIIQICHMLAFDYDGSDIPITGDNQVVCRFVIAPNAICPDLARFIIRPRFAYRSTGGAPLLRILENNLAFGSDEALSDEAGWTRVAFRAGGVPAGGMNTYTLEADLGGASLFELRGLVIELGIRLD